MCTKWKWMFSHLLHYTEYDEWEKIPCIYCWGTVHLFSHSYLHNKHFIKKKKYFKIIYKRAMKSSLWLFCCAWRVWLLCHCSQSLHTYIYKHWQKKKKIYIYIFIFTMFLCTYKIEVLLANVMCLALLVGHYCCLFL